MKIGIMGAMPEEISSLITHLQDRHIKEIGGRQFHIGRWHGHDIVLTFSRWGKVASAITAATLIAEFKVDQLIFTGVAGAVAAQLEIGDIVISEKLYQHDMDARPILPRFEIPLTELTYFKADSYLVEKAHQASRVFFNEIKISQQVLTKFSIISPKIEVGTIATGDQFIHSAVNTQAILQLMPDTLAVEMEGAAVAHVCHDYQIPFVVIRTISDKADHSSVVDFPRFIDEIARHYAEHIIDKMVHNL